jgi:formylglycine-generating enzyme
LVLLATLASVCAVEPGMVVVPAGVYRPLFRAENEPAEIAVRPFQLDVLPVTNGEFLEFVRANPRWQRSQVKRLFADETYLSHWAGDLDLGPDTANVARQPVTFVSWFAAKAYAATKGRRLPTTAEWEFAANAGFTQPDGSKEPEFTRALERWYSTPAATLPAVGGGRTNLFGLHDLHGLIWEWTSDFNSALVTGDARGDTGLERQLFCAGGSLDTKDRSNYPAFMRAGLRSSLKAAYAIGTLGFRCAKDL